MNTDFTDRLYPEGVNNINPQLLSSLSSHALFGHFMINSDRVYEEGRLLNMDLSLGWHPFADFRLSRNPTRLLKAQVIINYTAHFLVLVGCLMNSNYREAIEPITQLLLAPFMYYLMTLCCTIIPKKHAGIEIEKMSENAFAASVSTIFITLYLAIESYGCLAYTSLMDEAGCYSTVYGNWMLGYNALFFNISWVLVFWVLESDFDITALMRLNIITQYRRSIGCQILATLIFLYFFSQKEQGKDDRRLWSVLAPIFLGLWSMAFHLLCKNNTLYDAEKSFRGLGNYAPKTKQEIQQAKAKAKRKHRKHSLGLAIEKASSIESEIEIELYDNDSSGSFTIGGGSSEFESSQTSIGGIETQRSQSPQSFSSSSFKDSSQLKKREKPKGWHSKKLFALRTIYCLPTICLVPYHIWVSFNYSLMSQYYLQLLGILSFCCVCQHYGVITGDEILYLNETILSSKTCWERVRGDDGVIVNKLK
jgi:hypothetical protein